ncbi:hypothetical protein [Embleya sp. NPDC059237]|uniref:hypothetical protein n=1 Tax=Embleya sp. NPDC059237 TaxID=3346784 RepID=UPI0036776D09
MSLVEGSSRTVASGRLAAAGDDAVVSPILRAAAGARVTAVATATWSALAVTEGGVLVGAGEEASDLVAVVEGRRIRSVAAGGGASAAVTEDGTLLAGPTYAGEVMRAAEGRKVASVAIGSGFCLAVTEDGDVLGAGNDGSGQISGLRAAAEGRRVVYVAAGINESVAVTDDGVVLVSDPRQRYLTDLVEAGTGRGVTAVSLGGFFALALNGDGTLTATGHHSEQVAGIIEAAAGRAIATLAGGLGVTTARTRDGVLLAAGDDGRHQISGILAATAGRTVHTAAVGTHVGLAVIADADDDCGPLRPRQICASFVTTGDPQDTHALTFKVGTDHQELLSGGGCSVVDTRDTEATHLVVRRVSTGQDLATGSAYFTHDPATGAVDIDPDKSQLPHGLTHHRTDGNRFTFTWTT